MLFFIVLIALWVYPILAKLSLSFTRYNARLRKILLLVPLGLSMITMLALCAGVSTISEEVNFLMVSILYLSASQLLMFAFTLKNLFIKIITGTAMVILFTVGYLLSTIGILGVGFIIGDFEESRHIRIADDLVYKQYNLGNALSKYHSIEISIYKNFKWLPFIGGKVLTNDYDLFYKNPHHKNAVLHSYDFDIKYLETDRKLILLDSVKKDTLIIK